MTIDCPTLVRTRVLRATRLDDDCATPVTGAMSQVTSKGFTTIGLSPQYEDGEDIVVKNANDELCVNDKGTPQLTGIEVEIDFCQVDPALFTLITGDELITDGATPTPAVLGFEIQEGIVHGKFALEAWSNISRQVCAAGEPKWWWYHLFPLIGNAVWGDVSFENDAISFTVTGMTLPGNGWGVGPYDVQLSDASPGVPGPLLTPAGALAHYRGMETQVTPPPAVCGFQELPVSTLTEDVLAAA